MLPVPFNDLARASRRDSPKLQRVIDDVIRSGWFVHGPHHKAFEQKFASYLGVPHVVGVASGTDALEICLRTVITDERRCVVTVANAGGYATTAARAAGLDVRYCDIDPETLTIDPGSLETVLDHTVAAVVVTHLYGRLADVPAVRALCKPFGVRVIEDCAQAHGARNDAGMAGAQGDLAAFSFYPTKNLGALGDGGAISTADDILYQRLLALRQYGWTEKYRIAVAGGRNSRLDELQAAVLSVRLSSLDADNERRRLIIGRYAAAVSAGVRVLPAENAGHAGHLAVAIADDALALRGHLAERGVATDVHYPTPDHQQPAWADPSAALPVTEQFAGRVLSLPCFPELTDAEVDHVAEALASYSVEVPR